MTTKRFGTFEGVFTPTLLSILGVIMYLRLGWVVGNVGLARALLIICIANMITVLTSLSMSSIITNIKIGAGGAYSIISKSLGLEVGGAIGIPLYLSQAISVAFYITGFTELWILIFPQHSFLLISMIVWVLLLVVSYTSARLAFRLQYGIIAVIALSLVSAFLGKNALSQGTPFLQGLGAVPFWNVFAIFFPAVTGILAGVSMSGELKKPNRSIILGTLCAIGASFLIYISLAFWFAHNASPEDLVNNTSIIIDLARWGWLVIAGIMGATLSSALSMFVASPRTLQALSKHKIVPPLLSRTNRKGEPANAILFTAALAFLTLIIGNLNIIAGLLTMFFLITYCMINLSILIEKFIGFASFRPSFKIPLIFPFLGGIGCILAMLYINPYFSVLAIIIISLTYFILFKKGVKKNWPDIRKGFFVFLAERAIKVASELPYHPKIWKPSILVPIETPKTWTSLVPFLKAMTHPSGGVYLFKVIEEGRKIKSQMNGKSIQKRRCEEDMLTISEPLKKEGIFVSSTVADAPDFLTGASIALQTLKSTALPPNVLFVRLGSTPNKDAEIRNLMEKAESEGLGIIISSIHPKTGLGREKTINLWVREKSENVDLAVLIALQIAKNWEGRLRIIQVVPQSRDKEDAKSHLSRLKKSTRLPEDAEMIVMKDTFENAVAKAPLADINIFGMPKKPSFAKMRRFTKKVNTSMLFLKDSKQEQESATA